MSSESSPSPSCRILTVSSSVTQAKQLASMIVIASASNSATKGQSLELEELEDDRKHLLWTISNKYYTAPVHFSFAQTTEVSAQDVAEVPACIFVFSPTETFMDEFCTLIQRVEESDFEVSVAVSVPSAAADQQDDFETFFGGYGFEYVNDNPSSDLTPDNSLDDSEEVPGIRRIIDALSTILWPSMIQKSGKRSKTRSMVSVPGPPGEEDGLRSLLNPDIDPAESNTAIQREMAVLEKWLEEGADTEKDPWMRVDQTLVPSSTSMVEDSRPAESGFDDNFSDFVFVPNPPQGHPDMDNDPAFPSQEEVASMSQRLRELGMSNNDEGDSQVSFDLSHVLAALDGMKEEIAGISDEDEKKKAAAKVALALVYGLGEE